MGSPRHQVGEGALVGAWLSSYGCCVKIVLIWIGKMAPYRMFYSTSPGKMWPFVCHQKHPLGFLPSAVRILLKPDEQLCRGHLIQFLQPTIKLLNCPATACFDPCRRQPPMPGQWLPASGRTALEVVRPIPPMQPVPA
ncbi:hypothetical protein WR25_22852 [Diploscapter pachys]|uniref:Uncharacterized protein n=1 Tax=Diploscapter pachys TaxID=2018661 RepID=A0A2A2M3H5_9BILA|nr:hypothetical protein WR25_22852 [Diploscapter pachys]